MLLFPVLCSGRVTYIDSVVSLLCPMASTWILSVGDLEIERKFGDLEIERKFMQVPCG